MINQDIDALVEEALDAAVGLIQKRLGVITGDMAGIFFTSPEGDQMRDILNAYINVELMFDNLCNMIHTDHS